jgi:hypothetical protein
MRRGRETTTPMKVKGDKTAANPGGLPIDVFDELRAKVVADRSQFWKDLSMAFYGYRG